ncbi:hypothetical protein FY049_09560 [Acinetobacter sp. 1125_18A]
MDAIAVSYALALLEPLKGSKDEISAHKTISDLVDLLKAKQAEVDQLKHEKSLQELEINQVAQANQEWQRLVEEKDKKIQRALKIADQTFIGLPMLLSNVEGMVNALRGEDK